MSTTELARVDTPRRWLMRSLWIAILASLLYFALRNAPLLEIWEALQQLRLWQIGVLAILNAAVITLMAARWWIIVRAENPSVPFLPLIGYRLSAFGVSYFTPGPQIGGEPLQVLYLQNRYGLTLARATSVVIMDKLLEFLVNFILLGFGAVAVLRLGLLSQNGISPNLSLIGLAVLLAWPLVHIILLYHGKTPFSAILRSQPFLSQKNKGIRLIKVAERLASLFCRRQLRAMFVSIFFSALAVAGIVLEYYLMVSFLGIQLNATQVFAALTAMQASFLFPLPAGLGALEASQVLALGAFGQSASSALSLTLLIRARDILTGGLGLLLASRGVDK